MLDNNLIIDDLCFMVPTKDRLNLLNRLLESIYSQDKVPKFIIIVDGSIDDNEKGILKNENITIIYQKVFPPSLTAQRNVAISLIPENVSHAGFLDDDLVLLKDSYVHIVDFFQKDSDKKVGGISFNLVNESKHSRNILSKLFFLNAPLPGKISISGNASNSNNPDEDVLYTDWLCGGATVWRKEVFALFKFDEWFKGYALWEDVDFSFSVRKSFSLVVLKNAQALHLHQKGTADIGFYKRLGDVQIVDRLYFVKKYPQNFSFIIAVWSSVGICIHSFLNSIIKRDLRFLWQSYANLRALFRCVFFKIERRKKRI